MDKADRRPAHRKQTRSPRSARPARRDRQETAASGQVDPRLLPLLDLLAELMAQDIVRQTVAESGAGDRPQDSAPRPAEEDTAPGEDVSGKAGPIPKVPPDSQDDSHPNPTTERSEVHPDTTKETT
jgi:hypothetical protein